jgi:protein-L-isoaspartate(D-aspartate) O-methyltransferase
MVAVMTDLLELKPDDMVLEIGTGLGYQSAVLAELSGRVYSVEIIDELAQLAS